MRSWGTSILVAALIAVPNLVQAADDIDWWKTTVVYQIYPRSFQDSDGDGIGDLQGITSKLDHLKDLGVGAVWISPIFSSPMADFGYDISDFYNIDPMFGTMADFTALIDKANTLDIKVVLDFVPNHSSDEHEWFIKSKARDPEYEDYYVWRDPKGIDGDGNPIPPNSWIGAFFESVWTYVEERNQFYYHKYNFKQPDLDYRNDKVRQQMEDVMTFWLDKGAHGFRVDTVHTLVEDESFPDVPSEDSYAYVTNQPLTYTVVKEWRKLFDEYSKRDNFTRVLMTEAYGDTDQLMAYYGDANEPAAHFTFNFMFIINVNDQSSAEDFKNVINTWMFNMPKGGTPNWVIGNHDQHRVATRYGSEKSIGLAMLTQILPGIAVVYNGEEIGMENNFDISYEETQDPQGVNAGPDGYLAASRDFERTPFQWDDTTNAGFTTGDKPWLPIHANYLTLNLAAQKASTETNHYNIYKKLNAARQTETFLKGALNTQAVSTNVVAISRELAYHEVFVVVVNLGKTRDTVDLTRQFRYLPQELTVYAASSASGLSEGDKVAVTAIVLEPNASVMFRGDPTFPECT